MARERWCGACALAVSAMAPGMNKDSEIPMAVRSSRSITGPVASPVESVTTLQMARLATARERFDQRSAS